MEENARSMVMGSFVADSLALGVHWIYDTQRIVKTYGRVDALLKPQRDSYHPTKELGDLTHYGDLTLVLLESLAEKKGFDLDDFSDRWRALFDTYRGYVDQATRVTLSHYASGETAGHAGSGSDELAGAARVAPLVYRYRLDLARLIDVSRVQTRMTHNHPLTIDSAEFFSTVAWLVLNGMPPIITLQTVAQDQYRNSPIFEWVQAGIESRHTESVPAIGAFGQSCHAEQAFPGVIHLISKYENDLKEALIQSVMAGGDSAARGMLVGMVLGAYLGPDSIPDQWLLKLRKREQISELLERMP